jgi:hypothetical protein
MKTIAYLDCPTGISGDMCLGALLDAGVPLTYLQQHLSQLGLDAEFNLTAAAVIKRGQRAMQAQVTLTDTVGPTPARHLPTIEQIITAATLPQRVKDWSLAIFSQLGQAEAAVHGIPIDRVHFHEVGATDAIVDIVGTCLGFDYLDIDSLVCSPLPTGAGRVHTAHGWLPVPAPAVLKLMEMGQIPVYNQGLHGELVTPTGAAIATTLAQKFGEPPQFTLHRVGLGAGCKDLPVANILRLWIGPQTHPGGTHNHAEPAPQPSAVPVTHPAFHHKPRGSSSPSDPDNVPDPTDQIEPASNSDTGPEQDTITVLETQVDDLIPQAVGHLYDQLFNAGALDVFTQPIQMKKSRPGLLITVLCPPDQQTACETVLFTETTTLGIRHRQQQRTTLQRRFELVDTPYGQVSMKLAYHPHNPHPSNVHPEYEDCAALARRHHLPWQVIYRAALATWQQGLETSLLG